MNDQKITVDKTLGDFLAFQGEKWSLGYEVVGLRSEDRAGGGIVDLDPEKQLRAPRIQQRPDRGQASGEIVVVRLDDLEVLWRMMVKIANLDRVARRPKVHEACAEFCDLFGLPKQSLLLGRTNGGEMLVADLVSECRAIAEAILSAEGGPVELSDRIAGAFEETRPFFMFGSGGNVALGIDNVLLAAWFSLLRWGTSHFGVCYFCEGPNLSRVNAKFCSSYCRDRWHKRQQRGTRS